MGNCHFKTDFDTENITGKFHLFYINGIIQISNTLMM